MEFCWTTRSLLYYMKLHILGNCTYTVKRHFISMYRYKSFLHSNWALNEPSLCPRIEFRSKMNSQHLYGCYMIILSLFDFWFEISHMLVLNQESHTTLIILFLLIWGIFYSKGIECLHGVMRILWNQSFCFRKNSRDFANLNEKTMLYNLTKTAGILCI